MLASADLSEPEQRLGQAAETGALLDLGTGEPGLNDPAGAAAWDDARIVRAEWLGELVARTRESAAGWPRPVKLKGARIVGSLDLEAATLVCPLLLQGCSFERPIVLNGAQAVVIRLAGCHVPGVAAEQLATRGDLALSSGFAARGEVRLGGARIGGRLDLDGASLSNPGGRALSADRLTVELGMSCRGGFTADGEVSLAGARIGGVLALNGARLANAGGIALDAQRLTVEQGMYCRHGFTALGEVLLFSAHIGGQLNLDGASLICPDGRALFASHLTVEHSMFCRDGFTVEGEMRLLGAHIGGRLELFGARLANPGRTALSAERLTVEHSMHCRDGFTVDGEMRLLGARIGGRFDLDGACLANPGKTALSAGRLTVEQGMYCRSGFTADGEMSLEGSRIGGRLDFSGAVLTNPGEVVVDLEDASTGVLILRSHGCPDGVVDLTNTHVGSFDDDQESWPAVLRLRGFTYEILANDSVGTRARLKWLDHHQGGYLPALYDQLAATYQRAGRPEAARQVRIAKQWSRRRELSPAGKAWNWLLFVTVGYGYRAWLAGVWLVALAAAGSVAFASAYPAHMHRSAAIVPAFNPVVYTLDTLLPVVDLGQHKAWIAQGSALVWSWVLICAGWILTTAVVAGLTNALSRRD
jgi:hypothetical protein